MFTIRFEIQLSKDSCRPEYTQLLKDCELPFVPYPGLKIVDKGMNIPLKIDSVMYSIPMDKFLCDIVRKDVSPGDFNWNLAMFIAAGWRVGA